MSEEIETYKVCQNKLTSNKLVEQKYVSNYSEKVKKTDGETNYSCIMWIPNG
jgi:hypothetical protein